MLVVISFMSFHEKDTISIVIQLLLLKNEYFIDILSDKKDSSCGGAVFGVPLSCCVETTSRKRSSQLESYLHDESSPTAKASRSGSRASICSVRDRVSG